MAVAVEVEPFLSDRGCDEDPRPERAVERLADDLRMDSGVLVRARTAECHREPRRQAAARDSAARVRLIRSDRERLGPLLLRMPRPRRSPRRPCFGLVSPARRSASGCIRPLLPATLLRRSSRGRLASTRLTCLAPPAGAACAQRDLASALLSKVRIPHPIRAAATLVGRSKPRRESARSAVTPGPATARRAALERGLSAGVRCGCSPVTISSECSSARSSASCPWPLQALRRPSPAVSKRSTSTSSRASSSSMGAAQYQFGVLAVSPADRSGLNRCRTARCAATST